MSKRRGHLDDDDKFTQRHEELCRWFASRKEHAEKFARCFLFDSPTRIEVELEEPVYAANKFLYGYADVLLNYETDQQKKEKVLIEVKSSISDLGNALRQIKTYRTNLPDVTKTVLLYEQCPKRNPHEVMSFFGSQRIYVIAANDVFEAFDPDSTVKGYPEYLESQNVPAGKRPAQLFLVTHLDDSDEPNWGFTFWVRTDEGKSMWAYNTGNYHHHKEEFWAIMEAFGGSLNVEDGVTQFEGGSECMVDLMYKPDQQGKPQACLGKLYRSGREFPLVIQS